MYFTSSEREAATQHAYGKAFNESTKWMHKSARGQAVQDFQQCLGALDIWKRFKACCYLSYRLWDSSQADAISRGGTQQNGRKFLLGLCSRQPEEFFQIRLWKCCIKDACREKLCAAVGRMQIKPWHFECLKKMTVHEACLQYHHTHWLCIQASENPINKNSILHIALYHISW